MESFGLHYNNNLEMMEITLQACSKHAKCVYCILYLNATTCMIVYDLSSFCREIWIEQLTDAIKACVAANAENTLPLGHAGTKLNNGCYTCMGISAYLLPT